MTHYVRHATLLTHSLATLLLTHLPPRDPLLVALGHALDPRPLLTVARGHVMEEQQRAWKG